MRFGRVVSWEQDVCFAWRRSADNTSRPNSDVCQELPQHTCWLSARVEQLDIAQLYVIGSTDWKEVFGTYRLAGIAAAELSAADDKYRHSSRIVGIGVAYSIGKHFEPVSMVSCSGEGPFVVVDGNHRAVGMQRAGLLVGREVFVGLHLDIGTSFSWFQQAIAD